MSHISSPLTLTYNRQFNTEQYNKLKKAQRFSHNINISSPIIRNTQIVQHSFNIEFNDDESNINTDSFFTNTRKRTNCSIFTTTKKKLKLKKQVQFIDMVDSSQQLCEVIDIQAYKNSKVLNLKNLFVSSEENNNQCCCRLY